MVYMRVPLDVSKLRRVNVRELERRSDRSGKKRDFDEETELSVSESEVESGFIEADSTDLGNSTVRWISRLILTFFNTEMVVIVKFFKMI